MTDAELGVSQRPDEYLVRADEPRQLRVGRAMAVVIGPHGEDDFEVLALCRQQVDELAPLHLVACRVEDLFELVDDEDEPAAGRHGRERLIERRAEPTLELRQRVLARPHDVLTPAGRAGQHAARERGQQPGAEGRRLAAAGSAHEGEAGSPDEPRDQLGDEPLPAEVVLGIVGVERGQALVGQTSCRAAAAGDCEASDVRSAA